MEKFSSLVCTYDFEREAYKILPKHVRDFHQSGAQSERALKENEEAIRRYYIRPRYLVDVSNCDLSTTILGHKVTVPFGVAPMGFQKMAHPEGELANARAAAQMGTVFTLSTYSMTKLKDVAIDKSLQFFQLYVFRDREISAEMVRRAENLGFKAIVVTVDVPIHGIRYNDLRNNLKPPFHQCEYTQIETTKSKQNSSREVDMETYVNSLMDSSLEWKDIQWLKGITYLPIIVKGILTAEDAIKGVNVGASAIWVSNHGGRQNDGVSSTIEALSEVVKAVGHKCEVYVDGGFRTGSDIFKALAIGANMVFIGRPVLWGLTVGGTDGAYRVLSLLQNELANTMALSGYPIVKHIPKDAVRRVGEFSKL